MMLTANFPSMKHATAFLKFFDFMPDARYPFGDWGRNYFVPKPDAPIEQTTGFAAYLWRKPFGPDEGTLQFVVFNTAGIQFILNNEHEMGDHGIKASLTVHTFN